MASAGSAGARVTGFAARGLAVAIAPAGQPPEIGRRAAQQLARRELARPLYRESFWTRFWNWVARQLNHLVHATGSLPGGWWSSVALVAALVLIIAGITFWLRPAGVRRTRSAAVLTVADLSARDHRELASRHAADGDFGLAIVEQVRAVAVTVEDRGLLAAQPGRTADELAAQAGRVLPALASQLTAAAVLFDDVMYGGRAGTAAWYETVRALDDAVLAAPATSPAAATGTELVSRA
jgi:hypothetical protein